MLGSPPRSRHTEIEVVIGGDVWSEPWHPPLVESQRDKREGARDSSSLCEIGKGHQVSVPEHGDYVVNPSKSTQRLVPPVTDQRTLGKDS